MLQELQPVNLLARTNELSFPTKYSDPQRLDVGRKTTGRQQSITRGTASSNAKSVRINSAFNEPTARRKSLIKARTQSLASQVADKPAIQRKPSLIAVKHETIKLSTRPANNDHSTTNNSNLTSLNKQQPFQRRLSRKSSAISLAREQLTAQDKEDFVHPFEAPKAESPKVLADAVVNRTQQSPMLSQSSSEHTHHHYHSGDEHLPRYMRRPICAACNRNVKVTSSSETNNMRKSSSAVTASSTKSSFSSRNSKHMMHRSSNDNTNNKPNLALNKVSPGSTSSDYSRPSSMNNRSTSIGSISSASSHNSSIDQDTVSESQIVLRSKSPSSPIPTRRRKVVHRRKNINIKSHSNNALAKLSLDKWMKLLTQQQSALSALSGENSMILEGFDQMKIELNNANRDQRQAILLEIQTQVLQKFAFSLIEQQQQLFQYQKQQLLNYQLQEEQKTQTQIQKHMQLKDDSVQMIKSLDWLTKLEYDAVLLKWSMIQWTGNTIGIGEIEEQEFDMFGYPQSVVVSGVCVTVEPALLSKDLQKFLKPSDGQRKAICHKYKIQLTKDDRLFKFQLMKKEDWTKDKDVNQCEFSIRTDHKTNKCSREFGFFERRHHCRSCGHVFCQAHSANNLPLFVDNGQRGEWARVCDICFYRMIDPNSISRS